MFEGTLVLAWLFCSLIPSSLDVIPKCLGGKKMFWSKCAWCLGALQLVLSKQIRVSGCHGQLLIRSVSQDHPDHRLYHFLLGGSLCCLKTYWFIDAAKETGRCHQIRFIISWGHRSESPTWTCPSKRSCSHLWWTVIHFVLCVVKVIVLQVAIGILSTVCSDHVPTC